MTASSIQLTGYQQEAVDRVRAQVADGVQPKLCLYFPTGKGKTFTMLSCLHATGRYEAIVVAPPSTHNSWVKAGKVIGIDVTAISHAKFRMDTYLLERNVPYLVDEFHLFGGHTGKGWKKFEVLSKKTQAPLFFASATPNYNDAERVYCVERILDRQGTAGGYLKWLHKNCETSPNPFGYLPNVEGFWNYKDTEEFLASLPGVAYIPDTLVYEIEDVHHVVELPEDNKLYGLLKAYERDGHEFSGRIAASSMEMKHQEAYWAVGMSNPEGDFTPHPAVLDLLQTEILRVLYEGKKLLIYCDHARIARDVYLLVNALRNRVSEYTWAASMITGDTTPRGKAERLANFLDEDGVPKVLIGTASIATGTDGMDKVCDTLIILDDTSDDSLRRQLVGRIMPRGIVEQDSSHKRVLRLKAEFV